jgi:hypothetical protein
LQSCSKPLWPQQGRQQIGQNQNADQEKKNVANHVVDPPYFSRWQPRTYASATAKKPTVTSTNAMSCMS